MPPHLPAVQQLTTDTVRGAKGQSSARAARHSEPLFHACSNTSGRPHAQQQQQLHTSGLHRVVSEPAALPRAPINALSQSSARHAAGKPPKAVMSEGLGCTVAPQVCIIVLRNGLASYDARTCTWRMAFSR